MRKLNKKTMRNLGVAALAGTMAFGVLAPTIGQAVDFGGVQMFTNAPITISSPERAGVNTTQFGWAVGVHPGHSTSAIIASGEGWAVSVHAYVDRPWEVVVVGDPMKDVIFWIYVQAASRNSVGGNISTWTSRDVYRMQVVASGEGVMVIPIPDVDNGHGYQLKLGNPRFDNERVPIPTEPSEPITTLPEETQPSEPITTQPETTEPSEPVTTQPETTEPSEPVTSEPEVTEPVVTIPDELPTDPEVTEPTAPDYIGIVPPMIDIDFDDLPIFPIPLPEDVDFDEIELEEEEGDPDYIDLDREDDGYIVIVPLPDFVYPEIDLEDDDISYVVLPEDNHPGGGNFIGMNPLPEVDVELEVDATPELPEVEVAVDLEEDMQAGGSKDESHGSAQPAVPHQPERPNLPQTGTASPMTNALAGMFLVGAGIVVKMKKD